MMNNVIKHMIHNVSELLKTMHIEDEGETDKVKDNNTKDNFTHSDLT